MKRVIKFRGRDMYGKWHYGALLPMANIAVIYTGSQSDFHKIPDCELSNEDVAIELMNNEVEITDPRSIGQFTGLKDKNGTEVYEGDVIEADGSSAEVVFQSGRFGYKYKFNSHMFSFDVRIYDEIEYFEVIGNIHDNPELFTKGNKGGEQ